MRTLERNKQTLWLVNLESMTDVVDGDGFYTGEYARNYTIPTQIKIALYPSNTAISEELFGKDASFDMLAVSNDIVLDKDSLLFIEEPTGNYATTYDYSIDNIGKSLNTYQYGLKRRV